MNDLKKRMRVIITASATGTLLEWYDLFLAIILAKALSTNFFPDSDSTAFLETLAIVGSSFFVRPIGSLIFGSIGDRTGRKRSFLLSLLLMGAATFLIGLIPDFNMIGWMAPICLLVLRLVQGFALSGEYSGAIIYTCENSPPDKRGYYTGFTQATVPVGLLLCLMVVILVQSTMSSEDFNDWGMRIPFLSSVVLVLFSYLIRRRMEETPYFLQLKQSGNIAKSPVKEVLSDKPTLKLMLKLIFGGNAAQSAIMHSSQFVTLYFLQRTVHVHESTSYIILATALLGGAPFFQLAGKWSDKLGRKKLIYYGLAIALVSIPFSFYLFLRLGNPDNLTVPHDIGVTLTIIFILLVFVNTFASALVYGPMGAFIMEYFHGRTRYTAMGFTHNIGNGLIGGATPLITEFLRTTLTVSVAFAPFVGLLYPISLIVVALVINPLLPVADKGTR
ncbi:MAG TPA: MFS transporter [Chryseolinea sp.]|nr:MFS transporter [Chryseolinea sp.]